VDSYLEDDVNWTRVWCGALYVNAIGNCVIGLALFPDPEASFHSLVIAGISIILARIEERR